MLPKILWKITILVLFIPSLIFTQPEFIPYHFEDTKINSGTHNGLKSAMQHSIAYSIEIRKDNAPWLRLIFGEAELSSDSYILITALKDGAQQKLDAASLKEWNNTSAFFNGEKLKVELYVAQKDSDVFFNIEAVMVGEYNLKETNFKKSGGQDGIKTICGTVDNRTSSDNPAVGRIVPEGCTGWIPAAGVLVTAGHCAGSDGEVIEFNVPASLSDGTIQHPDPEEQYTIKQGTWNFVNGGYGNDWAVFEVYNNSATGLQPIQAQDAYFLVDQDLTGSTLRVTGCGVDGPAPDFGTYPAPRNSDNQTQQTHTGDDEGSSGTILRYSVDTQGGNSGSPVINESTQKAIGVHTNGGCTSGGGYNIGTSTYNTSFWNSISFNITLSSGQYVESGSGDYYKVNGSSVGGSFSGRGGIIEAVPPNGHSFANWSDGSYKNPRYLTEGTTTYATYKIINGSDDALAFSNNSQRKFIETLSGGVTWLHKVYTSGGHVWIEHSSDGGSNWILGNKGQPLDGTAGGKNPSIAYTNTDGYDFNYIGVVWQQSYSSTYEIMGKMFNQDIVYSEVPDPVTYVRTLHTEPSDAYGINANPNLVLTGGRGGPYFVTFERKSTSGSLQPGINWVVGHTGYGSGQLIGSFEYVEDNGVVTGTNAGTINTQMSQYPGVSDIAVNLIRQQGSPGTIYNYLISLICYNDIWQYTQIDDGMISHDGAVNSGPSVVSFADGNYSACWIEYYDMVFYYFGNSVKYYYGDYVKSCSINRGGGSSNNGFAVWSQNPSSNWSNKSIRFENGIPVGGSITTLSTTGKYVQVGNSASSSGTTGMYVTSFYPFSSPYYFSTASSPLSKSNPEIVTGRGFEINEGEASFSYRFEDLNVDGENIDFIYAPDTADYGKIEVLNNALVTEPFRINTDSKIVFTERSGFADSTAAVNMLGKDGYINYKVELIDEATGEVIGTVKDVNLTSSNAPSMEISSYSLNTEGLGGKTVRAQITLETNVVSVSNNSDESLTQFLQNDKIPIAVRNARKDARRSNLVLTKSFSDKNETLAKSLLNEITMEDMNIPTSYSLEQNYPNPFNPSTIISYQIPQEGVVSLKIYDILGREVTTLVNEYKSIGKYEVEFNAGSLASGVYIYKLTAGNYVSSKKMILMK
ncbi:MAG: T9SS type A sorting domain-containing protein [Ignavibacteria bacterium]|jgi:hypothetical protein